MKNHRTETGIWVIFYKKGSGKARVSYADAVEEALCFGWIDSRIRPIDGEKYKQFFSVRNPKSGWSKLNKDRVEKLTAQGLMTEAGFEKIEVAKQNGSWTTLDDVENLVPLPELQAFFKTNPEAETYFRSLSKTSQKFFLYRINNVKSPGLRKQRIEEAIDHLKSYIVNRNS